MVNVMARKVAGAGRSARLPVLHATAGVLSVKNLYIQQCAAFVDLGLRANNGSFQESLAGWTGRMYGVSAWDPKVVPVSVPEGLLAPRFHRMPFYDFDLQERWLVCELGEDPVLPPEHRVTSTFHTGAKEAEEDPRLKDTTHDFVDAHVWMEVGLQILAAVG